MKKSVTLCFLVMFSLMFPGLPAYATDVAAPEILSAKLTTPKTIGPGENICMDLKLREATGLNTVFASFNGPYGRTPYAQISSQSQTPEGLYEITLCTGPVENNSWPSGTYQLTNLWLYDTAGNNTSTLNEHAAVLNPTDFAITVEGTTADVAAPEILSAKLTTPKTIGPGENICMDLKLREATGINTVFASFNGPYGRTPYAQITSQSQTPEGLYEITLCTGPVENNSWPSGTYQLTNLWLYDTAGNNTSTLNEHAAVLNPTDFAITVEGTTADVAAPEILSAKLTTPKTIGPGENICMDLKLREATGINTVFASFNGPYGRTPYAQISSQSQTPEGLYEITLCTGPVENNSWPSGTYQLTNLWLYDTAGNNTSTLNEHAAVLNPTDFAITVRTVPYPVTPTPVLFTDKDGTAEDTYTVPATTGVDYLIGNSLVQAGTYPGAGTITVTAKARTDYTLTGTTEWTATFKATPYPVTPDPVVFTDKDGTAEDTYTVPATDGVDYLIGNSLVQAGTYPGAGTITVTAKARTDYTLTGTTEWTATFKSTPYPVTPDPVVVSPTKTAQQKTPTRSPPPTASTTSSTEQPSQPEPTHATGNLTITAKARTDYTLTGTTEWTATFKATPYPVTPDPVVFTDKEGTAEDTYTIPATNGVDYLINGTTIAAGTYPGDRAP